MSSWHAGVSGSQAPIPPAVLGGDRDALGVARHRLRVSDGCSSLPSVCVKCFSQICPGKEGKCPMCSLTEPPDLPS